MLDKVCFKELCRPIGVGKAYFRPFICKGDISNAKIFLVGINPATPIYPSQMSIEEYVELLGNYQKFIEFYSNSRIQNDKSEISRTRQGINSFVNWVSSEIGMEVVETDIITYPTPSVKELKKEPKEVISKGKDNFYYILNEMKPEVIILYGKKTLKYFSESAEDKNISLQTKIDLECPIDQLERTSPITSFNYGPNTYCKVFVCRHFMYYGNTGDSFREFRDNLIKHI